VQTYDYTLRDLTRTAANERAARAARR
jgi:hypothetical protein